MRIKVKRKLKEASSTAGITGHAGVPLSSKEEIEKFNENEKELSRLKEMFSSSTQTGGVRRIDPQDGCAEHCGRLERDPRNRALREDDDDSTIPLADKSTEDAESLERPSEGEILYPFLAKEILDHGYKIQEILGKGFYGVVFSAEDLDTGGDYVVKVVGMGGNTNVNQDSIDRELRNYDIVSQAAGSDERMWKHFPETYETWKKQIPNLGSLELGFIVMEKLVPLTSKESAFIPDINYFIARKRMTDAASVGGEPDARDQSTKAKWFISDGLGNIVWDTENAIASLTHDEEQGSGNRELDDLYASVSENMLKRYEMMQSHSPDKIDRILQRRIATMRTLEGRHSYDMANYYYILSDETAEAPYAQVILMDLMIAIVKSGKIGESEFIRKEKESFEKTTKTALNYWKTLSIEAESPYERKDYERTYQDYKNNSDKERAEIPYEAQTNWRAKIRREIRKVATKYINGIRESTSIPVSLSQRDIDQDEATRANYHAPGKDLFQAIQLLHDKTGLIARDVHDKNVMKREGGGDIVIVDLGLFKMDQRLQKSNTKITESRRYRLKILTKAKK